MRLFGRLLSMLFLVGVVFGVGFLLWTYGRLMWASFLMRQEVSAIREMAFKPKHSQDCYSEGIAYDRPALLGYQLRFLDNKKYQLEAVCSNSAKGPFLVRSGELPLGVIKDSGSGILIGAFEKQVNSRFVLKAHTVLLAVGVENGAWWEKWPKKDELIEAGADAPITSCEGWGYVCCKALVEVGNGIAEGRVNDCADSCFRSCKNRPVSVLFNSEPFPDAATRTVRLTGRKANIAFAYSIQDNDGKVAEVVVNFGDGKSFTDKVGDGSVAHEYVCNQPVCTFRAVLTAKDNDGLDLASSRLNTITIVLSDQ